jgi:hypothetical protein
MQEHQIGMAARCNPYPSRPRMPGILDISIRSLSFVSTLENSFGVTKPRCGRNAIGASTVIIEGLRRTYQIVLGTWSRFS